MLIIASMHITINFFILSLDVYKRQPEILLHNSIKNLLWDEIEAMRPDCTFVYLTHDIDFATSRPEGKRIWIRDYNADAHVWDYQLIENSDSLPEEVYIDILGSRKPILFLSLIHILKKIYYTRSPIFLP